MRKFVVMVLYYIIRVLFFASIAFLGGIVGSYFGNKKIVKKDKINDFERICKELDKGWNNISGVEKYVLSKEKVRSYVETDKDKLMQLKSEAVSGNYTDFITTIYSIAALCFSMVGIYISVFGVKNDNISARIENGVVNAIINRETDCFTYILVIIMVFFACLVIFTTNRFNYVKRWRGYILSAIDELEDEVTKNVN